MCLVQIPPSLAKPATCPGFDKKFCNVKKKLLCCEPPEEGEVCPTYTCLPKTYKGSKGKKCKSRCPLHCGEYNIKCEGPVDKKVIIHNHMMNFF